MFWGKGDTSQLEKSVQTTLAHIRRMEETGHIVTLNPDQSQIALRAIQFYSQWESVLKLFASLRNVALLVGGLLAMYWATEGWIIQQVQDIVTGAR